MSLIQSGKHPNATNMSATELLWREISSNSRDWVNAQNLNRPQDVDVTAGGTIALTIDQQYASSMIRLIGTPSGAFNIQLAEGTTDDFLLENGDRLVLEDGTGNILLEELSDNSQLIFENVSGQTATIDTPTGAASPATVEPATTALIQVYGIEIVVIGVVGLEVGALVQAGAVNPTATINFADFQIKKALMVDYGFVVTAPTISSGVLVLDLELGNYFNVSITEDITTLTLSNPIATQASTIVLIATQDSTGDWVITWPANVEWEQGTGVSPTHTTDANARDIFKFITIDGGVTWQGIIATLDSK